MSGTGAKNPDISQLIELCLSAEDGATVHFKAMHAVLMYLARQMRLLDQKVEIAFNTMFDEEGVIDEQIASAKSRRPTIPKDEDGIKDWPEKPRSEREDEKRRLEGASVSESETPVTDEKREDDLKRIDQIEDKNKDDEERRQQETGASEVEKHLTDEKTEDEGIKDAREEKKRDEKAIDKTKPIGDPYFRVTKEKLPGGEPVFVIIKPKKGAGTQTSEDVRLQEDANRDKGYFSENGKPKSAEEEDVSQKQEKEKPVVGQAAFKVTKEQMLEGESIFKIVMGGQRKESVSITSIASPSSDTDQRGGEHEDGMLKGRVPSRIVVTDEERDKEKILIVGEEQKKRDAEGISLVSMEEFGRARLLVDDLEKRVSLTSSQLAALPGDEEFLHQLARGEATVSGAVLTTDLPWRIQKLEENLSSVRGQLMNILEESQKKAKEGANEIEKSMTDVNNIQDLAVPLEVPKTPVTKNIQEIVANEVPRASVVKASIPGGLPTTQTKGKEAVPDIMVPATIPTLAIATDAAQKHIPLPVSDNQLKLVMGGEKNASPETHLPISVIKATVDFTSPKRFVDMGAPDIEVIEKLSDLRYPGRTGDMKVLGRVVDKNIPERVPDLEGRVKDFGVLMTVTDLEVPGKVEDSRAPERFIEEVPAMVPDLFVPRRVANFVGPDRVTDMTSPGRVADMAAPGTVADFGAPGTLTVLETRGVFAPVNSSVHEAVETRGTAMISEYPIAKRFEETDTLKRPITLEIAAIAKPTALGDDKTSKILQYNEGADWVQVQLGKDKIKLERMSKLKILLPGRIKEKSIQSVDGLDFSNNGDIEMLSDEEAIEFVGIPIDTSPTAIGASSYGPVPGMGASGNVSNKEIPGYGMGPLGYLLSMGTPGNVPGVEVPGTVPGIGAKRHVTGMGAPGIVTGMGAAGHMPSMGTTGPGPGMGGGVYVPGLEITGTVPGMVAPETVTGIVGQGTVPGIVATGTVSSMAAPETFSGMGAEGTVPGMGPPRTVLGMELPGTPGTGSGMEGGIYVPGMVAPGPMPVMWAPETVPEKGVSGTMPVTGVPGTLPGTRVPGILPGTRVPGILPGMVAPGPASVIGAPKTVHGIRVPGTVPGTEVPVTFPGMIAPGFVPDMDALGTMPRMIAPGTVPGMGATGYVTSMGTPKTTTGMEGGGYVPGPDVTGNVTGIVGAPVTGTSMVAPETVPRMGVPVSMPGMVAPVGTFETNIAKESTQTTKKSQKIAKETEKSWLQVPINDVLKAYPKVVKTGVPGSVTIVDIPEADSTVKPTKTSSGEGAPKTAVSGKEALETPAFVAGMDPAQDSPGTVQEMKGPELMISIEPSPTTTGMKGSETVESTGGQGPVTGVGTTGDVMVTGFDIATRGFPGNIVPSRLVEDVGPPAHTGTVAGVRVPGYVEDIGSHSLPVNVAVNGYNTSVGSEGIFTDLGHPESIVGAGPPEAVTVVRNSGTNVVLRAPEVGPIAEIEAAELKTTKVTADIHTFKSENAQNTPEATASVMPRLVLKRTHKDKRALETINTIRAPEAPKPVASMGTPGASVNKELQKMGPSRNVVEVETISHMASARGSGAADDEFPILDLSIKHIPTTSTHEEISTPTGLVVTTGSVKAEGAKGTMASEMPRLVLSRRPITNVKTLKSVAHISHVASPRSSGAEDDEFTKPDLSTTDIPTAATHEEISTPTDLVVTTGSVKGQSAKGTMANEMPKLVLSRRPITNVKTLKSVADISHMASARGSGAANDEFPKLDLSIMHIPTTAIHEKNSAPTDQVVTTESVKAEGAKGTMSSEMPRLVLSRRPITNVKTLKSMADLRVTVNIDVSGTVIEEMKITGATTPRLALSRRSFQDSQNALKAFEDTFERSWLQIPAKRKEFATDAGAPEYVRDVEPISAGLKSMGHVIGAKPHGAASGAGVSDYITGVEQQGKSLGLATTGTVPGVEPTGHVRSVGASGDITNMGLQGTADDVSPVMNVGALEHVTRLSALDHVEGLVSQETTAGIDRGVEPQKTAASEEPLGSVMSVGSVKQIEGIRQQGTTLVTVAGMRASVSIPSMGDPGTVPDTTLPETLPGKGAPETMPGLAPPGTVLSTGTPGNLPDMGASVIMQSMGATGAVPGMGATATLPSMGPPGDVPVMRAPGAVSGMMPPGTVPGTSITTPGYMPDMAHPETIQSMEAPETMPSMGVPETAPGTVSGFLHDMVPLGTISGMKALRTVQGIGPPGIMAGIAPSATVPGIDAPGTTEQTMDPKTFLGMVAAVPAPGTEASGIVPDMGAPRAVQGLGTQSFAPGGTPPRIVPGVRDMRVLGDVDISTPRLVLSIRHFGAKLAPESVAEAEIPTTGANRETSGAIIFPENDAYIEPKQPVADVAPQDNSAGVGPPGTVMSVEAQGYVAGVKSHRTAVNKTTPITVDGVEASGFVVNLSPQKTVIDMAPPVMDAGVRTPGFVTGLNPNEKTVVGVAPGYVASVESSEYVEGVETPRNVPGAGAPGYVTNVKPQRITASTKPKSPVAGMSLKETTVNVKSSNTVSVHKVRDIKKTGPIENHKSDKGHKGKKEPEKSWLRMPAVDDSVTTVITPGDLGYVAGVDAPGTITRVGAPGYDVGTSTIGAPRSEPSVGVSGYYPDMVAPGTVSGVGAPGYDMGIVGAPGTVPGMEAPRMYAGVGVPRAVPVVGAPEYVTGLDAPGTGSNVGAPRYDGSMMGAPGTAPGRGAPEYVTDTETSIPDVEAAEYVVGVGSPGTVPGVRVPGYNVSNGTPRTALDIGDLEPVDGVSATRTVPSVGAPGYYAGISTPKNLPKVASPKYIADKGAPKVVPGVGTSGYYAGLGTPGYGPAAGIPKDIADYLKSVGIDPAQIKDIPVPTIENIMDWLKVPLAEGLLNNELLFSLASALGASGNAAVARSLEQFISGRNIEISGDLGMSDSTGVRGSARAQGQHVGEVGTSETMGRSGRAQRLYEGVGETSDPAIRASDAVRRAQEFIGVTREELDASLLAMQTNLAETLNFQMKGLDTRAKEAVRHISAAAKGITSACSEIPSLFGHLRETLNNNKQAANEFSVVMANKLREIDSCTSPFRQELDAFLETLKEGVLSEKDTGMSELMEKYDYYVVELDKLIYKNAKLFAQRKKIADGIIDLQWGIESVSNEKADCEEVKRLVEYKATFEMLRKFINHENFPEVVDQMKRDKDLVDEQYEELNKKWIKKLRAHKTKLMDKVPLLMLMQFRESMMAQLNVVNKRIQELIKIMGDPDIRSMEVKRNETALCGVCKEPSMMYSSARRGAGSGARNNLTTCLIVAELEDESPHYCQRWVGGSHTLLNANRIKLNPPRKQAPEVAKPYLGKGYDGRSYPMSTLAEPCVPCEECTILNIPGSVELPYFTETLK